MLQFVYVFKMNELLTNAIEFSRICRVCLKRKETMIPLFEYYGKSMPCKLLIHCTRISLSGNDGGPHLICGNCMKDLIHVKHFIRKCLDANYKVQRALELNKYKDDVEKCYIKDSESRRDNSPETSVLHIDTNVGNNQLNNTVEPLGRCNESTSNENNKVDSKQISNITKHNLIKRQNEGNVLLNTNVLDKPTTMKKPTQTERKIKSAVYSEKSTLAYECNECTKTFTDKKILRSHIRMHAREARGKQLQLEENPSAHASTPASVGRKPFHCDMCEKSFSKKDNLQVHRKRHLQQRDFSCERCGRAYYTACELRAHARSHSGERPHACAACGKRFTARNNLLIHQRTHTGERPHECTICGKRFISTNILTIHKRSHTGEKPYVCSVCGARFAANKLALHMRTHTGEKPHACSLCGKQFGTSNMLRVHARRHTGEQAYACPHCPRRYAHSQSLNKHLRRHHKLPTNTAQPLLLSAHG